MKKPLNLVVICLTALPLFANSVRADNTPSPLYQCTLTLLLGQPGWNAQGVPNPPVPLTDPVPITIQSDCAGPANWRTDYGICTHNLAFDGTVEGAYLKEFSVPGFSNQKVTVAITSTLVTKASSGGNLAAIGDIEPEEEVGFINTLTVMRSATDGNQMVQGNSASNLDPSTQKFYLNSQSGSGTTMQAQDAGIHAKLYCKAPAAPAKTTKLK